ncbi:MAG: TIR domain-containing protein [Candidatus Omnitrophota bacterium]
MRDIFISYASPKSDSYTNDRQIADMICSAFEAENFTCWICHRDIPTGGKWLVEMHRAVENSKLVILVFSSNANQSQFVMDEITHALSKNIPIIPFRIEDVPAEDRLDTIQYRYQWMDAFTLPIADHVSELVLKVRGQFKRSENELPEKNKPAENCTYRIIDATNPFHISGIIRDEKLFFGRYSELGTIWGELRKGCSVSIVGPRQSGKSSLLWHIKEKAARVLNDDRGKIIETVYIDMELISTSKDFFEKLGDELKTADCTIRGLQRDLEKRRIILCLDEFDRTEGNEAFPPDFFSTLRGLSQAQHLILVVATKIPLIDFSNFNDMMTSPFYNIFQPFPLTLGPLKENEARELLTGIAKIRGKELKPKDIESALAAIHGYDPWKVQLIGWCWFDSTFDIAKAIEKYQSQFNGKKMGRGLQTWMKKIRLRF